MRLRAVFKIKIPDGSYNHPLCGDLSFHWVDTRVDTREQ